ncbi:MAG: EVE domain-containing protein, partial [Cyanobacteria bacterium P01_C01_bin.89]
MAYWLLKSEPNDYSYDDLIRDRQTIWDGVNNNLA